MGDKKDVITTQKGEELAIQDKSTKTFEEAFDEYERTVKMLLKVFPWLADADVLIAATAELLHWMYTEPGKHAAPSAMFHEALGQVDTFIQARGNTPEGKTSD
jgi:hypothetical protein